MKRNTQIIRDITLGVIEGADSEHVKVALDLSPEAYDDLEELCFTLIGGMNWHLNGEWREMGKGAKRAEKR